MSIKQQFMEMLQVLQHSNSFEYDVISHLKNIDFCATISNIIYTIDASTNTVTYFDQNPTSLISGRASSAANVQDSHLITVHDLESINSKLLELQHIYLEIESETQKMCNLNYTRCIQFAASSEELQSIIYELQQYEGVFGKLFDKWRGVFNYLSSVLYQTDSADSCILEQLCNPLKAIVDVIESSLSLYKKNTDNKLKAIEMMSESVSEDGNAGKTHYSHICYSPQGEQTHSHLSAADRNELHRLMSLPHSKSFKSLLFKYIDETGMTDAQVYKAAGISKQVFSYIRNGKQHTLKKENVVSICIVLHLSIEKTLKLLASCGYGLSEYITFDRIINFCISRGCYDVDEINELLDEYNQKTICGT